MKFALHIVIALLFAGSVRAEYMKWEILSAGSLDTNQSRWLTGEAPERSGRAGALDAGAYGSFSAATAAEDIGGNFRYYVELVNFTSGACKLPDSSDSGRTYAAQALKNGVVLSGLPESPASYLLALDAFVPIPEPCSAGLAVFGLALMALRRKKV